MRALVVLFVFLFQSDAAPFENGDEQPPFHKTCPIPGDPGSPVKMTPEIADKIRRIVPQFDPLCSDKDFKPPNRVGDPKDSNYIKSIGESPGVFVHAARALFETKRDGIHYVPGHAYYDQKDGWKCWFGWGGKEHQYNTTNGYYFEVFTGSEEHYAYIGHGVDFPTAPPIWSVPSGIRTSNGAVLDYSARRDWNFNGHGGYVMGKVPVKGDPFYYSYDGDENDAPLGDHHGKNHQHVQVLVCKS